MVDPREKGTHFLTLLSALEPDLLSIPNPVNCLLCDKLVNDYIEIFSYDTQFDQTLPVILESVVKRRLYKAKMVNTMMCLPCVERLISYFKHVEQLKEMRQQIKSDFDSTNPKAVKKRHVEPVITTDPLVAISTKKSLDKDTNLPEPTTEEDESKKIPEVVPDELLKEEESSAPRRKSTRSRKRRVLENYEVFLPTDPEIKLEETENVEGPPEPKRTSKSSGIEHKCQQCDFKTSSSAMLDRHSRQHSGEKPFTCELCGKSFALKFNLNAHMKSHNEDRPFSCEKCEKAFKQRHSLREHVLKNHENVKKFGCQYCDEKFMSRHLSKAHERTHTGERGFFCEECGDQFATKQGLTHHMSKHNGEYLFRCEKCGKGFNNKTLFKEHDLIHTGDKPFECDLCGKKFSNRGTFWIHKKQHLNAKPYKCTFCDKAFTHSSHLAVHKRTHTGERPYKCHLCVNGFISANHLRRHMKMHLGSLPFVCQQCSQQFKFKSELDDHCKKEHHGVVVSKEAQMPDCVLVGGEEYAVIEKTDDTKEVVQMQDQQIAAAANLIQLQSSLTGAAGSGEQYTVVNIENLQGLQDNQDDKETTTIMVSTDAADQFFGHEATEIQHNGQTLFVVTIPEEMQQ